jgi:hypothetical protein
VARKQVQAAVDLRQTLRPELKKRCDFLLASAAKLLLDFVMAPSGDFSGGHAANLSLTMTGIFQGVMLLIFR